MHIAIRRPLGLALAAALLACGLGAASSASARSASTRSVSASIMLRNTAPRVHVVGNRITTARGHHPILRGVVRSGMEYMPVETRSIADGPMSASEVAAMKAWHVNVVRIPVNEDAWNGRGASRVRKAAYRSAVINFVHLLNGHGIIAIIDLHWTDGPSGRAINQQPMPDLAHGIPFWTSVAKTFKGNNSVIFDLFNEPYPPSWSAWRNGGRVPGISYRIAGMQTMVNAIRATGATNVLMVAGMHWASDLSEFNKYAPTDPAHNIIADWHAYSDNQCNTPAKWNSTVAPVAAKYPVIAGEFGGPASNRGGSTIPVYVQRLLPWLDAHHMSYTAWGFETDGGPNLLSSYSRWRPNAYGAWYKSYISRFFRS
jgi:endoglucanase